MKPLDPRLLRYARAARAVFGLGAALGVARTLAIIVWCWCVGQALATLALPVLARSGAGEGRVAEGAAPHDQLPWLLAGAVLALAIRAGAGWAMDLLAARGAIRVKAQLRACALDAIDARSPEWAAGRSDAGTATLLGRGLDALDGYFSGYVPQLILAVCATPILVLAVLLADPVSGVIVCIVFPVIPVFMILIGLATQAVQDRQWAQLQRLSESFLDAVSGLATLKIFRREGRQTARIERETEEYRSRTMRVLRVTFLSGFVLDLAGTFSVALVAVTVGTRLVSGEFPLALGLFVLLLVPEAFIPIRQVGAAFHASTEGLTAARQAFEIIEDGPAPHTRPRENDRAPEARARRAATAHSTGGGGETGGGAPASIRFDGVVIARDGRPVVGPVSFEVAPGEVVALAGPSGAGKSTLVAALLGFVEPDRGAVERPADLAWCGQRPGLLQGTVADNVALGSGGFAVSDPGGRDVEGAEPVVGSAPVRRALDAAGLPGIDPARPLGASGAGLSGGQAQRVAIARCLHRAWSVDAGAVVLDEPTSALDSASEAGVCRALRSEARDGRAVLVISHRGAVLEAADRVVRIDAATAAESRREAVS